jgi:hypothetical protein
MLPPPPAVNRVLTPVVEDLEPGELQIPSPLVVEDLEPRELQIPSPPVVEDLEPRELQIPSPPVVEDLEPGELQIPSPPPADYVDPPDMGGRPSTEQAARIVQFVQVVRKLALAFGKEMELNSDRFINTVSRSLPKRGSWGGNGWNTYEAFARSEEHCVEEYQRIQPSFDPRTMELPPISAADLSAMYKQFQEVYPDGQAEVLLEKYSEWTQLRTDETMASRQRQFDKICNNLRASVRVFFLFARICSKTSTDRCRQ